MCVCVCTYKYDTYVDIVEYMVFRYYRVSTAHWAVVDIVEWVMVCRYCKVGDGGV